MNRNQLKYLALISMLIDHIGMFFVPTNTILGFILRVIGRIAGPTFCMFLAEGFIYTSNRTKYAIRLLAAAILSQFAYLFAEFGTTFAFLGWNMIFTLFISFMMLLAYENIENNIFKWISVTILISITLIADWPIVGPLLVLNFYCNRNNKKELTLNYCAIVLVNTALSIVFLVSNKMPWYKELWHLGMFLFVPLIYLYDGKKFKTNAFNKWLFYIFYPLHLVVLALIKINI